MKKSIIAGALFAGLLLTTAGCAQVSGTVQGKTQTPATTEWDCDGTGKKRRCGWETNPAECQFEVQDDSGKLWMLDVPCDEYDQYNEGDHYPRG